MEQDTRQRFQGKCLIGSEGRHHMKRDYDNLSPEVRAILASSVHNICPACLAKEARHSGSIDPKIRDYHSILAKIEAEIGTRQVYGPDHPQAQ